MWLKGSKVASEMALQNNRNYDLNKTSGCLSIIFASIAISLFIFSLVYMFEGGGWISAYDEDPNDLYLDVGWNWVRGSGVAFIVAMVLVIISTILLSKNKRSDTERSNDKRRNEKRASYLLGKLDLNKKKGFVGLVLVSVALTFLANGVLYRIEYANWLYGGIYSAQGWFFEEASAWASSAYYMFLISILLATVGSFLLVMEYKRNIKNSPK